MITSTKLYVPAVTLSINYNIKFLENIKVRLSDTLDYLIDPKLRNINRLFFLSFKNGNNDPMRDSFISHYIPLVEIKDLNELIDNKPFFDQPAKKIKKRMENLLKCQEMMIMQQGIYWIVCIIKIFVNLFVEIYQDKKIRIFLKKLILREY